MLQTAKNLHSIGFSRVIYLFIYIWLQYCIWSYQSLVCLFALCNPMWLILKLVSLHLHPYWWESTILSSKCRLAQERKEERWDWVEQIGKAGAYLWLTNWRRTGLGQWNPVCLWVWSVIWPFQLVFCLWVSPYFLFTLRESQSSVVQKNMLITLVWTSMKSKLVK